MGKTTNILLYWERTHFERCYQYIHIIHIKHIVHTKHKELRWAVKDTVPFLRFICDRNFGTMWGSLLLMRLYNNRENLHVDGWSVNWWHFSFDIFVQTWPDGKCSHTVQLELTLQSLSPVVALYDPFGVDVPLNCDIIIITTPFWARNG